MADFNIKSKRDEEVESLAMSLRRNKLASSDSEARRMAEEMLTTSKKVQDDFAEKEKRLYGSQKKVPEVELAHKQMEQLASNIARGKTNVRIDISEIDVSKPLKDLVRDEYDDFEKEDDEVAEELKEEPGKEVKSETSELSEEPSEETVRPEEEPSEEHESSDDEGDVGPGDEPSEPLQADEFGDDEGDKGEDKDDSEEESAKDKPSEETSEESSEDEGGDPDFSVKEIDNREQLKKSEEERRKEREKMAESKVDLNSMFNVHK